jgi:hypothetical protein
MADSISGAQLTTVFITLILITIPFAILNGVIARRKGKSSVLFGLLRLIPFLGLLFAIYLVSLHDKDLIDKINRLLDQRGQS